MNLTKAKVSLVVLKMTKDQNEIRGNDFAKKYLAFVERMDQIFQIQYNAVLYYIEQNPHLFAGEEGIVLEKTGDYLGKAWDESNVNHIKTLFIEGHMIGQGATNKDVVGEVNVLMEINNEFAKDYAENHAAEFMTRVDETTKKAVNILFNKAFLDNWSQSKTAEAIQTKFSQFSKYRAALIANMEMSNAYEYGKKQQFDGYASRFGTTGWKRSETQHDSNVRYEHTMNEIEGWIPENKIFGGTGTDHAPHGFFCRCVTMRRLTPPNINEITATQVNVDGTSFMDDTMKNMVVGNIQDFRKKFPFLPKVEKLTDFQDASPSFILGAAQKNTVGFNAIPSQWDMLSEGTIAGSLTGNKRNMAVVYHEMAHFLNNTIYELGKTDKLLGDIPWKDIDYKKTKYQMNLLKKWQSGEIASLKYPLEVLDEKGYDSGLKEIFAEVVVSHIMGVKTDVLDEDMRDFLTLLTKQ